MRILSLLKCPFSTTAKVSPFTPTPPPTPTSPSPVRPATALVLLNMGGPATLSEVGPFLRRLFSDNEIIPLGPLQQSLGALIARSRTSRIEKQYERIGGSPIRKWTTLQGERVCTQLDQRSPHTAPHKAYIMFRYVDPLTADTIQQMLCDGVKRVVAFSQYPQFSCTTTGSSFNHLWRELSRLGHTQTFKWSLIDRWNTHPKFIEAVSQRILAALNKFPSQERNRVILVFSAHSLPMRVVNKGDPYTAEVAATVQHVMAHLRTEHMICNSYVLAWQSQVGFLPWMGPQTGDVIKGFAKQGHRHLLLVPIAFTSDHVETLYEIDVEYSHIAKLAGITHFERAESLNDSEAIVDALSCIAHEHLETQELCSTQYQLNCANCTNPMCRSIVNPIKPYKKLRDANSSVE